VKHSIVAFGVPSLWYQPGPLSEKTSFDAVSLELTEVENCRNHRWMNLRIVGILIIIIIITLITSVITALIICF
jgi:hypothetical protein